jgi:excisionase family DNA binding protein
MMPGMSTAKRLSKHKTLDGGEVRAISVLEAAARLRVGRNTMQRLIAEKKIRSVRIGRMIRVPVAALDEYLAKLEK